MIIAVAGEMGSGKDTVAEHLVKNYGFKRMAFADDLKFMCMNAFDLTEAQCFDEKEKFIPFEQPKELTVIVWHKLADWIKNNGFELIEMATLIGLKFDTPRHILQFVGTEICRDLVDTNYHVKVLKKNIDKGGHIKVAIADCRFPNERQVVTQWGGIKILVNERKTAQKADDKAKAHGSENSLGEPSEYDFVIANNESLESLYSKADKIIQAL